MHTHMIYTQIYVCIYISTYLSHNVSTEIGRTGEPNMIVLRG